MTEEAVRVIPFYDKSGAAEMTKKEI